MEQNLSLYYVFHTVAKKGSISHAAKELYISQPAISKSIQKLEDNLNTTLFKRSSRGVTLTADGEILFQHTRDAFDTLEEGEEILARHHALGVDQLRIGVSTTLCKYILLPHLQRFIKAYPHVKISISCQSTYQTLTLLEENKIDIGLVGEPAIQKGFYFQPLQKIQDIFVTTTAYLEHLELRSGNGDLFQTATFMMLDEENITRQYINRVFLEHGVEFSNILEVSTMDLLIEFAKIGMGAACVIQEFVQYRSCRNDFSTDQICFSAKAIRKNLILIFEVHDIIISGVVRSSAGHFQPGYFRNHSSYIHFIYRLIQNLCESRIIHLRSYIIRCTWYVASAFAPSRCSRSHNRLQDAVVPSVNFTSLTCSGASASISSTHTPAMSRSGPG